MNNHSIIFIAISLVTLTLAGCSAAPEDNAAPSDDAPTFDAVGAALSAKCPPAVDPSIAVPSGNKLALTLDAVGLQVYVCQATDTGYAWTLRAPDATLYDARGREVGSHYAGPTWEYKDESRVVGAKRAEYVPDTTSVPWLLLEATSHTGKGKLAKISYIQRLNTEGGLAPAAATCTAQNLGELSAVDYAATYYFFVPGKAGCGCK